jgi:hypothetical protein
LLDLLGDLNHHIAVANFELLGAHQLLAPGFEVLHPPGKQLPGPTAKQLRMLLRQIDPIDLTLPPDDLAAVIRYMVKMAPWGYGPMSRFQAETVRKLSPKVVEIGGGNGFNANLLNAVSPDKPVASFDDWSYRDAKYLLQYAQNIEGLGGPKASADLTAAREWVFADPERFVQQLLAMAQKRGFKVSACRSTLLALARPYEGVVQEGGPEKLRNRAFRDHDLFISYVPTEGGLTEQGFLARCLPNLASSTNLVHLIPGNIEGIDAYPVRLIMFMASRGWRLKTVIPSSLPNSTGFNDVLTFERGPRLGGAKMDFV